MCILAMDDNTNFQSKLKTSKAMKMPLQIVIVCVKALVGIVSNGGGLSLLEKSHVLPIALLLKSCCELPTHGRADG